MHEAGIARTIADAIREHGLDGVPVRVLVSGGHDAPVDFDASLRFHLEAVIPGLAPGSVEIVHRPMPRWCPACGDRSDGLPDGACPACGGATLGSAADESIELEWDAVTVDRSIHADGPSVSPAVGPVTDRASGPDVRPDVDGP